MKPIKFKTLIYRNNFADIRKSDGKIIKSEVPILFEPDLTFEQIEMKLCEYYNILFVSNKFFTNLRKCKLVTITINFEI